VRPAHHQLAIGRRIEHCTAPVKIAELEKQPRDYAKKMAAEFHQQTK
jgi:hypothetical protein